MKLDSRLLSRAVLALQVFGLCSCDSRLETARCGLVNDDTEDRLLLWLEPTSDGNGGKTRGQRVLVQVSPDGHYRGVTDAEVSGRVPSKLGPWEKNHGLRAYVAHAFEADSMNDEAPGHLTFEAGAYVSVVPIGGDVVRVSTLTRLCSEVDVHRSFVTATPPRNPPLTPSWRRLGRRVCVDGGPGGAASNWACMPSLVSIGGSKAVQVSGGVVRRISAAEGYGCALYANSAEWCQPSLVMALDDGWVLSAPGAPVQGVSEVPPSFRRLEEGAGKRAIERFSAPGALVAVMVGAEQEVVCEHWEVVVHKREARRLSGQLKPASHTALMPYDFVLEERGPAGFGYLTLTQHVWRLPPLERQVLWTDETELAIGRMHMPSNTEWVGTDHVERWFSSLGQCLGESAKANVWLDERPLELPWFGLHASLSPTAD